MRRLLGLQACADILQKEKKKKKGDRKSVELRAYLISPH